MTYSPKHNLSFVCGSVEPSVPEKCIPLQLRLAETGDLAYFLEAVALVIAQQLYRLQMFRAAAEGSSGALPEGR